MRALKLGDMLCSVPALRALRHGLPKSKITLLGLPWARKLVERLPQYLDDFIEFPGFPGIPERPFDSGRVIDFLASMRCMRFDLAIQMHGSGTVSNAFVALLGALHSAGCYRDGGYRPEGGWFTPYPEDRHEVLRCLAPVEHLGITRQTLDFEFPVTEADQFLLRPHLRKHGLESVPFVCIHPGAFSPSKCWSPWNFARVADGLAEDGYRIVLTGSPREAEITAEVQNAMRYEAIDSAVWDLDLGPLAALLSLSRLLVCNDTGVSHLAAAIRLPSVVVFTETDPRRWAPLDVRLHSALRIRKDLETEARQTVLDRARMLLAMEGESERKTHAA